MQVKNQLFEEIAKEYSLQILKWAYKKCGDSDRAEELTQEVMVQIFSAIQKSASEGKRIEQVEHFVWKIARYVWCHSLRKNPRYVMCPLEEDLSDESDFAGELAEREEREQMIVQLRKQVKPFCQICVSVAGGKLIRYTVISDLCALPYLYQILQI